MKAVVDKYLQNYAQSKFFLIR